MKIVNKTPHQVRVFAPESVQKEKIGGRDLPVWTPILTNPQPPAKYRMLDLAFTPEYAQAVAEFSSSAPAARVAVTRKTVEGGDLPLFVSVFGEIENLPAPEEGTWFIVSALVASRAPERTDLITVGEAVYDRQEEKQIGCVGLNLHPDLDLSAL